MQERVAMCLEEGEDYPQRLTIAHEAPLLSDGLSERLEAWLSAHKDGARLIIIDVLQKIRPPRRRNGDIYANRVNISVTLVDHSLDRVSPGSA
jgi:hypothetical protein